MEWREREFRGDGITLRGRESGSGPAVLLLHGFPDLGWGWRHQAPALAAAGFRVLVPDLRGYGRSDRPQGVCAYALDRLVADIAALLAAEAEPVAAVAGHDWGGVIAWAVAARHPRLLHRLIILNAPHGALYRRELRRNPRQLLRSWYVAFNQLPFLPEVLLRARACAAIRGVLGRTETGERMAGREELEPYVDAFSRDGALTAALNYYRAAARDFVAGRFGTGMSRIHAPTLVIWGDRDPYLDARLLEGLDEWVDDVAIQRLPHAGHFVHWQDPGTVNELMLAFLQ